MGETDRQTDRQKERETDRDRQRQRETQRGRERERQRGTEREGESIEREDKPDCLLVHDRYKGQLLRLHAGHRCLDKDWTQDCESTAIQPTNNSYLLQFFPHIYCRFLFQLTEPP